jgi:hypothetical protein
MYEIKNFSYNLLEIINYIKNIINIVIYPGKILFYLFMEILSFSHNFNF